MSIWSSVLDSCPGLLCCVINLKGKLLYASHGYKAVAARLFGHKCTIGGNYPPLITKLDKEIHGLLTAACLGNTNAVEVTDNRKIWEITASPLRLDDKSIEGVVLKITSENINNVTKSSQPVIQSNPEILDSVPFRACVVNPAGIVLAVNKFLKSSFEVDLTGKNIVEFVKLDANTSLMRVLASRSGTIECKIPEIVIDKNFYDGDINVYFDADVAPAPTVPRESEAITRLHASPIKWNGQDNIMLTFEDVTEFREVHDQLRRLLTFDTSTGLLNRRGIEHVILHEFATAVRNTEQLSLIMINIDNFKHVNAKQGYVEGSTILRGFVNIMQKFLAAHTRHYIARWGGDEFMILAHCSGAAAVVLANEIRERANGIEISAGVADLNKGGYAGINDFIGAAYDAMIEAKLSGKNVTILSENS